MNNKNLYYKIFQSSCDYAEAMCIYYCAPVIFNLKASGIVTLCRHKANNDEITPKINSKKLVLFGSYGWGNGEWFEKWKDNMLSAGAVINIEPLAINETPEGEDELKCIDFGKKIISSYN